jgi:aspartokinase
VSGVRAVVSESKIAWVRTEGVALDRLVDAAGHADLPMKEVHAVGHRIAFVVPLARVPDWARGRAALAGLGSHAVSIDESMGAAALVGDGITRDVRVMQRALAVMRRLSVTPSSAVTTAFRISVLVPRDALESLTRALHAEFVESDGAAVALDQA